jgi:hypothetical protein
VVFTAFFNEKTVKTYKYNRLLGPAALLTYTACGCGPLAPLSVNPIKTLFTIMLQALDDDLTKTVLHADASEYPVPRVFRFPRSI